MQGVQLTIQFVGGMEMRADNTCDGVAGDLVDQDRVDFVEDQIFLIGDPVVKKTFFISLQEKIGSARSGYA